MGRRLNIENDPAAFHVLLTLVEGGRNPKEIASLLKIRSPSVVYHLNRLRKIGLVKRDEKLGKLQPYQIEWKNLYDFALKEWLPRLALSEESSKLGRGEDEKFRALISDDYFQRFLKEALKTVSQLALENRSLVKFGLKSFIRAMPEVLKNFQNEEMNLKEASPLFAEFVKKLMETKRFTHISYRWVETMEKMNLITPLQESRIHLYTKI